MPPQKTPDATDRPVRDTADLVLNDQVNTTAIIPPSFDPGGKPEVSARTNNDKFVVKFGMPAQMSETGGGIR